MKLLDLRDPAALDRPVVRGRYCLHLTRLLEDEGIASEAVLDGSGLTTEELAGDDARINYAQELCIYRNALALSRQPGLGFRLGHLVRISDHGVFGYAIQASADLAQALRIVERYATTTGPLLELTLEFEDDEVAIVLKEVAPLGPIARMAREEILVLIVRSLLRMTDPPTVPIEVRLDLPPEDPALDRRELGIEIRYGRARCEVVVRATDLTRPLAFSDEETALVCERRCEELLERLGSQGDFVERVRRTLVSDPGRFPNAADTARQLGVSSRTLRRRLQDAETSFQSVLEDVRKGLALDYLQRSNLTIDEIASLLGYSEAPNFYRAFKSWTGHAPSVYR